MVVVVSCAGGRLDGRGVPGRDPDAAWDGAWHSAVHRDEQRWCAELAVPLETLADAGVDVSCLALNAMAVRGFPAETLNVDLSQEAREQVMNRFRNGQVTVLVATDVAARGLDIDDISHVFNFDLPQDAADYVHRIGRTARLGAKGEAISFACEDFAFSLPEIEDYIGYPIPMEQTEPELLPEIQRVAARPRKDTRGRSRTGGRGQRSGGQQDGDRPKHDRKRRPRRRRPKGGNDSQG